MDNITKLLKGFVIAGGVALIAGTILLVVMIFMRASGDPAEPKVAATNDPAAERCAGGTASVEPLSVPLPVGAHIEQIVPGNCLILLGVDGEGRQFVALVDPLTGERISLLLLRPDP